MSLKRPPILWSGRFCQINISSIQWMAPIFKANNSHRDVVGQCAKLSRQLSAEPKWLRAKSILRTRIISTLSHIRISARPTIILPSMPFSNFTPSSNVNSGRVARARSGIIFVTKNIFPLCHCTAIATAGLSAFEVSREVKKNISSLLLVVCSTSRRIAIWCNKESAKKKACRTQNKNRTREVVQDEARVSVYFHLSIAIAFSLNENKVHQSACVMCTQYRIQAAYVKLWSAVNNGKHTSDSKVKDIEITFTVS